MSVEMLLAKLESRGISLRGEGGELVVDAPRGMLDPILVEELRSHKEALLSRCRSGIDVELDASTLASLSAQAPDGAGIESTHGLSPLQEGILLQHRLNEASDPYIVRMMLVFDSHARMEAFLAALGSVINRHAALRSSVHWQGLAHPVQVVWRQVALPVIALEVPAGRSPQAILEEETDPRHARIDLTRAPLFSAVTVPDADGRYRLALLFHHIVCDHLSLDIVIAEVQAYLDGRSAGLAEPIPYHRCLQTPRDEDMERHEAFFREQLQDVDTVAAPFGVMRHESGGESLSVRQATLEPALAHALRRCAKEQRVGVASLAHLALARVVAACSGGDDVVLGTVLTGRNHGARDVTQAVGMFLNTLPLRAPSGALDVGTALQAMHQALGLLLEHEQAPLSLARRCTGLPAQAPLFAVVMNYRRSASASTGASVQARAWDGIRLESSEESSTYPLTVIVDDWDGGLACTVKAAPGIRGETVLECLRYSLQGLVDALSRPEGTILGHIGVLPPHVCHRQRETFNPPWETPADVFLHGLVERHAETAPDAPALRYRDRCLTYGQLNERANRLAHFLRAQGIGTGERVALCMHRGVEVVTGMLAVLKLGAVYVPVDPTYPEQRLAYLLEDSAPAALLTTASVEPDLPALGLLRTFVLDDTATSAHIDGCAASDLVAGDIGGETPAYVIYTSGSTGKPKGVVNVHRGLANLARQQIGLFDPSPGSRILQFSSTSFDASIFEIAMAFAAGATLCLADAEHLLPGGPLQQAIADHAITHLTLPPSVLALLEPEDLSSVRTLVVAGEVMKAELARRFVRGRRLFNAYGPSEATVCASAWQCLPGQADPVPIGFPLRGTRVHILDRYMQEVPAGAPGELYLGGAGVAQGYLHRDALTAERFVADPFSKEGGALLYRTGDMGEYASDGAILYAGRNDAQVKVRGFRVEPGEIERRLESLPGIEGAIVLAVEDEAGHRRLIAYVVGSWESSPEDRSVRWRASLKAVLPDYMVPSHFVPVEAWPLTPHGKIDRKALERMDVVARTARTPPRNAVESKLAAHWAKLLGMPPEHVDIDADFFTAGGDSMLAARFVTGISLDDMHLDIRDIFEHPTIRQLGPRVRTDGADGASGDIGGGGPVAIIPNIRHAFGVSSRQTRDWWNLFSLFGLPESCTPERAHEAFKVLVERHDALRQNFVCRDDGSWEARIAPFDGTVAFTIRDASAVSGGDIALMTAEHRRMVETASIERGPLIQLAMLDGGPGQPYRLLCCAHHYVIDGVSMNIIGQEFAHVVDQLARGLPPKLPPLPVTYRQYVGYLEDYAHSPACLARLDYWSRAGARGDLGIPLSRPDGKCYVWCFTNWPREHDASALLDSVDHQDGKQLEAWLIALFARAYARWSGRDYLWMNVIDNGRKQPDGGPNLDRMVGWIATMYPLLLDVDIGAPIEDGMPDLCRQVHDLPRDKSFGLLKFLHPDPAVRQRLADLPEPRINFNFLGRTRTGALPSHASEPTYTTLPLPLTDEAYPKVENRESLALGENYIMFVCSIIDRNLHVSWNYNAELFDHEAIERFDAAFADEVRRCKIPEASKMEVGP
ncbi:non-ribosomal peptide synthetase [Luteibacter sahnii]|uniref:non-ribosomal peptide synthetase n=1 Tax=Luteibacter sahnii TaxID=3021977 RepID=UPI002A6AAAC6|nr:non-ribosomal peptide synthetase [Luteibacter sp. PPL193]MDY1548713.1 amino acid adenylation domain-containing protein [Luteibacter sp. PPL193]